MSARLKWGIAAGIVAVLTVATLAVLEYGRGRAWWGESDAMRMVRADALADPTLLGLDLADSRQEQRAGSLQTSGPVVTNCFVATDDGNGKLLEAIDFATSHGWTEVADTRTQTTWVGAKPANLGGKMSAILTLDGNSLCAPGELAVLVSY
jgi:hypothetical protein